MRLIRWFVTFILLFIAAIMAGLLLALLLVAVGLLRVAGLVRWIRPSSSSAAAPAAQRDAVSSDADLPAAPPGVAVHHLRSWDAARNRAVDRWYYKDADGQWVFVRAPRTA